MSPGISLSAISLSYNGGKDCLILLILLLSLLSNHPNLPNLLPAIYIPPRHPFLAVEVFVASSAEEYHLTLARYSQTSMRDAFADYLRENTAVKAIFVGTRRTDPHGGKLGTFQPTDGGWPGFMRVHPVIEWKYGNVWAVSLFLPRPRASILSSILFIWRVCARNIPLKPRQKVLTSYNRSQKKAPPSGLTRRAC